MKRVSMHRIFLGVLALGQVVCHQAILTAPPDSTIALFANPEFIAANGEVSVISALVIEPAGTVVPDGTVVQFFTTLGRIDEQGKTNDGVARVNLVSDSRSGIATVTGVSGGEAISPTTTVPSAGVSSSSGRAAILAAAQATVTVTIGSGRPATMIVTADPVRIRSNDPRHSRIVANVFDENGNPTRDVPVFFRVEESLTGPAPSPAPSPGPPSTEFMRSAGGPVFTDSNGQAVDFLETRYPRDADPKTVLVRATTPTGVEGTVEVIIN